MLGCQSACEIHKGVILNALMKHTCSVWRLSSIVKFPSVLFFLFPVMMMTQHVIRADTEYNLDPAHLRSCVMSQLVDIGAPVNTSIGNKVNVLTNK